MDIWDVSDNDIFIGSDANNNFGFAKVGSQQVNIISNIIIDPENPPTISSNGQYIAPGLGRISDSEGKFIIKLPHDTNSYNIIPLKLNGQLLSTGVVESVSDKGTIIVENQSVAHNTKNTSNDDVDFNQYICPDDNTNAIQCHILQLSVIPNVNVPLRNLVINNNVLYGIAATPDNSFGIYSINQQPPYQYKLLPGLEKFDFGNQSGIQQLFDDNTFDFAMKSPFDGQFNSYFYNPITAQILPVADAIDHLHIPNVHGQDFKIQKISHDGRSFVLANTKLISDYSNKIIEKPKDDDILVVIITNNKQPLWKV